MSSKEQVNENELGVAESQVSEGISSKPYLKLGIALITICFICVYLYTINKSEEILPSSSDKLHYQQIALQNEQDNNII